MKRAIVCCKGVFLHVHFFHTWVLFFYSTFLKKILKHDKVIGYFKLPVVSMHTFFLLFYNPTWTTGIDNGRMDTFLEINLKCDIVLIICSLMHRFGHIISCLLGVLRHLLVSFFSLIKSLPVGGHHTSSLLHQILVIVHK